MRLLGPYTIIFIQILVLFGPNLVPVSIRCGILWRVLLFKGKFPLLKIKTASNQGLDAKRQFYCISQPLFLLLQSWCEKPPWSSSQSPVMERATPWKGILGSGLCFVTICWCCHHGWLCLRLPNCWDKNWGTTGPFSPAKTPKFPPPS